MSENGPDSQSNSENERYVLRLYVTGMTPKAQEAIRSIMKICDEELYGQYDLKIIDIYQQPELAKGSQVIAAPTLVKSLPPPLQKFIGDLADPEPILVRLAVKGEQVS